MVVGLSRRAVLKGLCLAAFGSCTPSGRKGLGLDIVMIASWDGVELTVYTDGRLLRSATAWERLTGKDALAVAWTDADDVAALQGLLASAEFARTRPSYRQEDYSEVESISVLGGPEPRSAWWR